MKLGELLKDEKGVPCPVVGTYWSLSHKPECVAAVSKDKVGIDIEEMKPRIESLFAYVAGDEEWKLKEKSWDTFFSLLDGKRSNFEGYRNRYQLVKSQSYNLGARRKTHYSGLSGSSLSSGASKLQNHIISVLKDEQN